MPQGAVTATGTTPGTLDLNELIDGKRITPFQIGVIACCASAAFVDGLDTQSIGIAAPLIVRELALPRGSTGTVFAVGLLGAMIGALVTGSFSDRFGRRPSLILSLIVMGLGTLGTAVSGGLSSLLAWRFIAGFGLGAATPCFVALSAEFAPARVRGLVVSTMWSAFPLGGFVGGLVNPLLVESFGWKGIFLCGGILPLVVALVCVLVVPESLRYLAARHADVERIRAVARRLSPAAAQAERFTFHEPPAERGSFLGLLRGGYLPTTLLLWIIFMITFSALVFQPLWLVSLLTARPEGLTLAEAAVAVAMCNLGSVIGTATIGRLFDHHSVARVMAIAFVLGAGLLAAVPALGSDAWWVATAAFLSCLCLGGASAGALTVAASLYPTVLRSTGVGSAISMARLAQIGSSLVIGAMLGAGWSAQQVFVSMGVAVLIAAIFAVALSVTQARLEVRPEASAGLVE